MYEKTMDRADSVLVCKVGSMPQISLYHQHSVQEKMQKFDFKVSFSGDGEVYHMFRTVSYNLDIDAWSTEYS